MSEAVKEYIDAAGSSKRGSCHLLRHTAATLMLDGGADIRFIAEMLGRTCLETTQIYTRVAIYQLRRVHAATHPGARPEPCRLTDRSARSAELRGRAAVRFGL